MTTLGITGSVANTIPDYAVVNGSDYSNLSSSLISTTKKTAIDELSLRSLPATRRFTGLVPAINTDTTKWQVGIGTGQIVDAYTDPRSPVIRTVSNTVLQVYSKPALLNGVQTILYAYYFWTGSAIAIGYQANAPVADDLVDKLFVAAIISTNGTNISEVRPISLADEPDTKNLLNYGAVNVDNIYPQPISNTMRLGFGGGRFKFAGRNAYTNPKLPHTISFNAIAQITYTLCDPNGNVLGTETNFNFNRFWNGTAVVPLANTSYASTQFLYLYPSGVFAVVLGINEYTSLALAADQWSTWETKRQPPNFRNNSYFLGAIAGLGSATNIANTSEVLTAYGSN